MELTDFQKWIINGIIADEIVSYRSFSYRFGEIVKMKIDTNLTGKEVPKHIHHYFKNSKENYIGSLKEYFSLVVKLSKNGLIILVDGKISSKEDFLTMKDTDFMTYELEDYRHKDIITLPELASFVKRGYLTYDEFLSEKERGRPWRIALFIAVLTVLINAGVLFGILWFFGKGKPGVARPGDLPADAINVRISDEIKVSLKEKEKAPQKDAEVKIEKKKEKKTR